MIEVRTRIGDGTPLRGIPMGPNGTTVLGILIGDSNAVGWGTTTHDIPVPQDPEHCRIWSTWSYNAVPARYPADPVVAGKAGRFVPLRMEGGGARDGGEVAQTIGPEGSLAAARYDALRPHAVDKRGLEYGIVKFAIPGSVAHPAGSPRASWAPPIEDADADADGIPREFVAASRHPQSAFRTLLDAYILPAVRSLTAEGRLVLIDALYMCLGSNDCVAPTRPELDRAHRDLGRHVVDIWDGVTDALGTDVPLVCSKPLFNSTHAPLERTEIARYRLEDELGGFGDAHLIGLDALSRQIDGSHFTGRAQIGHGMLLANVWDREPTRLYEQGVCDPVGKLEGVTR